MNLFTSIVVIFYFFLIIKKTQNCIINLNYDENHISLFDKHPHIIYMLDDIFAEALHNRDTNIKILEKLQRKLEKETNNKNFVIDVLALNDGQDLITESFYSHTSQTVAKDIEEISKENALDYCYMKINSGLVVISLGEVKINKSCGGKDYGHRGKEGGKSLYVSGYDIVNYLPIGYVSKRIYKNYDDEDIEHPLIIYRCEVLEEKSKKGVEMVISVEKDDFSWTRDDWGIFSRLFSYGFEFHTIEDFFGLTDEKVVEAIKKSLKY